MKSGNINQYKHLSNFDNLKSFNSSMEQWYVDIHQQKLFTKSELIALKRLVRFSACVFGVCNAKIQTIVSATHNDAIGISRSTFKRMLVRGQDIGLITIYRTFNHGKQGHNVYIFNRYVSELEEDVSVSDTIEPPQQKPIEPPKTSNLSKTNNHNINIRTDNVIKDIPVGFQDLVKFYYEPKQIIELWRCVKNSTRYLTYMDEQQKVDLGIRSFKQMICNIKLGYSIKKSIYAYYWGILQGNLDIEYKKIILSA
ncbi:hypothetical protein MKX72_07305 [Priestia sp. FSL R5-0597]|uniref:hypothetical protein n=1 Tax=Priestia TaxID=2800373 RepID=UPI0012B7211B|nr:hypothetical protein [Priestia megaterium]